MAITLKSFINLPDTLNPTTDNGAHRVQVVGNLAYIADWIKGGLQIWNVGNPTAPTFVGSYNVNTKSRGLQVVGNLVYLADQDLGLKVINVSNPAAPVLVGNYDTVKAYRVRVVGELAYVSDGLAGVQIIDISPLAGTTTNPILPPFVGNAVATGVLPSDSRVTELVGNLLYVAESASGFKIYNVSNPAAPILLSSTDTESAGGILVTGKYALISDGTAGLKVFDVSNPAAPVLVETYDTPGKARSTTIVGKNAFVADGTSLQVLNVADLTNITLVGSYAIPGANVDTARGVEIEGLYAYVGLVDAIKGVDILDVSDFDNSVILTSAVETVNANTGDDTITGTYANLQTGDSIDGGAGTDTLIISGGAATNTIAINAGSTTNQFNLTGVTIKGFERFDHSGFLGKINFAGSTGNDWVITGAGADTLSGSAGDDTLSGGAGVDILNGGSGKDSLTGGAGNDTHVFQFGQSTVALTDSITDFAFGGDKIDLLTQGGLATAAPTSFSRAANSTATTLTSAVTSVFTDANGALAGNQALGIDSAALIVATNAAIAGTYLVVNDGTAGFQAANDLVVNLTGYTGTLPAVGNITPVTNVFV